MSDIKETKLATLTESEGFKTPEAMLETLGYDTTVPAICMTPGCDYTTYMEPDQREGWCESCNTGTVVSMLVLADII
jgi:hypothetical protein